MTITFAKHAGKHPSMTCLRDDGSSTWMSSPGHGEFFVEHDLLHYSVETTLGYQSAFFGMVAGGRDIDDFGTREGVRDERPMPMEAGNAEVIVGLIQRLFPGTTPADFAAFSEAKRLTYIQSAATEPEVSEEQFAGILRRWRELVAQWRQLPADGTLELTFS